MTTTSFTQLIQGVQRVIRRFPIALLVCLIGTGLGIASIHMDDPDRLFNLIVTLTLAAPVFVVAALFSEVKNMSSKQDILMQAGIGLVLVGYYTVLPDLGNGFDTSFIRHIMWTLGFILVLTFVPFVLQKGPESVQRFWQYNRGLVFAFLLTIFWVWAIQLGLSVALMAIDVLFDVGVGEERFAEIGVVLVGLFAPLFFLHRLPQHPHSMKVSKEYPKEVRLFSTYVLVPLVTIYFLILYTYTVRILVSFEWPSGQLAWMILGFSLVGVLTYAALYPLRESQKWVRYFGNGLFMAMIPQMGMLFWSLSFRLRDYGITENRYFVLLFGMWLLSMAIYYLVSRTKDLRLIPATLFVIAVVSSFGPWGAFEVSERSQVHRLEKILERNALLIDGVYVQPTQTLSVDDEAQINEIIRYLSRRHGFEAIQPWFEQDLEVVSDKRHSREDKVISEAFGLRIRYSSQSNQTVQTFGVFVDPFESDAVEMGSYEYMVDVAIPGNTTFEVQDQVFGLSFSDDQRSLIIRRDGQELGAIDLSDLIELGTPTSISRADTILSMETEQVSILLSVEDFLGEVDEDRVEIRTFQGLLFLMIK